MDCAMVLRILSQMIRSISSIPQPIAGARHEESFVRICANIIIGIFWDSEIHASKWAESSLLEKKKQKTENPSYFGNLLNKLKEYLKNNNYERTLFDANHSKYLGIADRFTKKKSSHTNSAINFLRNAANCFCKKNLNINEITCSAIPIWVEA